MNSIQFYIERFRKMNRNRKEGETAPHKAIMLIAVMDEIARGNLTNGFVPVNDRMVRAFENIWRNLVGQHPHFQCKFAYPFYHLTSEVWWKLAKTDTYVERKEYSSVKSIRESFYGAFLPEDLWGYMENEATRRILKLALLETLQPNRNVREAYSIAADNASLYGIHSKSDEENLRMAA